MRARKLLVAAAILLFMCSPAFAQPQVQDESDVAFLFRGLFDFLFAAGGCSVDPDGGCAAAAAGDCGSSIDPTGNCWSADTKPTPPPASPTGDGGCKIDPNGGCTP
jgi:hypothetical protein